MNLSLRQKLISLNVGIGLSLGLCSVIVLNLVIAKQSKTILSEFEGHAKNIGEAISAQFYERYGDVQAFAINPDLKKDKTTASNALNAYAAMYGIYDLILVIDANGKLAAVNSKGPDGKDLSVENLYSKNFSDEPWFKDAINGKFSDDKDSGLNGTVFSDAALDPYTSEVYGGKKLSTAFTAPIKDSTGKVIGVVSNRAGIRWVDYDLKMIVENFVKQGKEKTNLYLLTKNGELITEWMGTEQKEVKGIVDAEVLTKKTEKVLATSTADALLGNAGSVKETDTETKVSRFVGYTSIFGKKFVKNIGWKVLVADEETDALEVLTQAKSQFYYSFGIVFILSLVVGYFYSLKISTQLTRVADHLAAGSGQLSQASNQISASSDAISNAATEQAAAIQQTAAAIEEVSAMVRKSSENAKLSRESSAESASSSEEGYQSVQKMITAVSEIKDGNERIMNQVTDGNKRIGDIVRVIGEIAEKTKVINDIVFQTKLLSFNASVEAARAGEHGKGFAVVAEEVGNLAQMSGNAAKEISQMLESSMTKVRTIVEETAKSVEHLVADAKVKVDQGKSVSEDCGHSLEKITESVRSVDSMVQEIAQAATEQSQGINEINKAVTELDQTTQMNAAIARETAVAAETLKRQSREVNLVFDELYTLINGKSASIKGTPSVPTNGNPHSQTEVKTAEKPKLKVVPEATHNSTPSSDDPRFEDVA